jgi:hypothetical protein
MSKVKEPVTIDNSPRPNFKNQEAYEQYLIGLAYNLVEERLLNGTATSQETTHLLKMGSAREKRAAELERMQIELMEAKKEALDSQRRMESLYKEAIEAVKSYASPVTMGGPDSHD